MANGRLGAADLAATTDTLIYTCPASTVAMVCVNLVSRGGTQTVRLAIGAGAPPTNADYLEYEYPITSGGAPLLREGLILAATDRIYVRASAVNVSCVCYGKEEAA